MSRAKPSVVPVFLAIWIAVKPVNNKSTVDRVRRESTGVILAVRLAPRAPVASTKIFGSHRARNVQQNISVRAANKFSVQKAFCVLVVPNRRKSAQMTTIKFGLHLSAPVAKSSAVHTKSSSNSSHSLRLQLPQSVFDTLNAEDSLEFCQNALQRALGVDPDSIFFLQFKDFAARRRLFARVLASSSSTKVLELSFNIRFNGNDAESINDSTKAIDALIDNPAQLQDVLEKYFLENAKCNEHQCGQSTEYTWQRL